MSTISTRPDKGKSKKTAGFVQPLDADDPRLPQFEQTPADIYLAIRAELAQLQADVTYLRAELDRRDIEQIELEGAVEFLHQREGDHQFVLGLIVHSLGSCLDPEAARTLYPRPGPSGRYGAGLAMTWRRPERRWSQFGSLADLRALADRHGVTLTSDERRGRQRLVRRLWRAWLLPGSVDLLTEKIERDRQAS